MDGTELEAILNGGSKERYRLGTKGRCSIERLDDRGAWEPSDPMGGQDEED